MGRVFHKKHLCFITFEVYMFKDSNLLCWKEESLRQPVIHALKEATPTGFLTLFDSF